MLSPFATALLSALFPSCFVIEQYLACNDALGEHFGDIFGLAVGSFAQCECDVRRGDRSKAPMTHAQQAPIWVSQVVRTYCCVSDACQCVRYSSGKEGATHLRTETAAVCIEVNIWYESSTPASFSVSQRHRYLSLTLSLDGHGCVMMPLDAHRCVMRICCHWPLNSERCRWSSRQI